MGRVSHSRPAPIRSTAAAFLMNFLICTKITSYPFEDVVIMERPTELNSFLYTSNRGQYAEHFANSTAP